MKTSYPAAALPIAALAALACAGAAHATEGFEPRYNLAGSLGGELFAPPQQSGWIAGLADTHISVSKVTGDDGRALTLPIPGGVVPLPAPTPSALYPSYGANLAHMAGTGTMTRWDLAFGYLSHEQYGGGRLIGIVDLPYGHKDQSFVGSAATPNLSWNAAVPAPVQSAVQAQFAGQYQGSLAEQGVGASGVVSGQGDAELQGGWLYVTEQWRVLAGASVILPTGQYGPSNKPDIGTGNFKTLRPAVQAVYLPTPEVSLALKFSVGLNGRNKDNQLRSGNWAGLETAAGYKTPVGVVGLHAIRLQQYQDDDNNPLGPSRFRATSSGAFFTTLVPGIDAALTLQYIATTSSRNAKDANFAQVRIVKLF